MQNYNLESANLIAPKSEILRSSLATKVATAGSRPERPINALFWLEEGAIARAKDQRIDMLMRSSLSGQQSEDPDMALLRDLYDKKLPIGMLRSIAVRFVEKDFESERKLNIDELTGLFTRRFCIKAMEELIESYLLGETDTAICFVDIDKIKEHNDTEGFEFGTGAMQAVAYALQGTGNIAGRFYAGDEDLVLMPGITPTEIKGIMETVRTQRLPEAMKRVKKEQKPDKRIGDLPVSFKYGFTSFSDTLEYFIENNIDVSALDYPEMMAKFIDTTLDIVQTYERLEKARSKHQGIADIEEGLKKQFDVKTESLLKFCSKRKPI